MGVACSYSSAPELDRSFILLDIFICKYKYLTSILCIYIFFLLLRVPRKLSTKNTRAIKFTWFHDEQAKGFHFAMHPTLFPGPLFGFLEAGEREVLGRRLPCTTYVHGL